MYGIIYDDGHGMHTSPRDQKEIGGSFAYNFTGLRRDVCTFVGRHRRATVQHSRPVKLDNRSG